MSALQSRLYGISVGGWDAEGKPCPAELRVHALALHKDAIGLLITLGSFFAIALLCEAEACPRGHGGHVMATCTCAVGAASALVADLLLNPCPALSDPKGRAIRGIGHFAYFTVNCLSLCTVHLCLSAVSEGLLLDPVARVLPWPVVHGACRLHAACHATSEFVAAAAVLLSLLYYPLALGLRRWDEEEVQPWRRRGVSSFKALNLYSHGVCVPCALADLFLVKRQWLVDGLRALWPVELFALAFVGLYLLALHLNFSLAAPAAAWPYSFMHDVSCIGPPPPSLARFGIRAPFSLGWVLLTAGAIGLKLLIIGAVQSFRAWCC